MPLLAKLFSLLSYSLVTSTVKLMLTVWNIVDADMRFYWKEPFRSHVRDSDFES